VARLVKNQVIVVRAAILLSFLPDMLTWLHVLPTDVSSHVGEAFAQKGFGAVDVLSSTSNSPVAVDAVNRWASEGLQGLF